MWVSPQCSPNPLELWLHNPRIPGKRTNWGSPFPNPSAETVLASVSPLRVLKAASYPLAGNESQNTVLERCGPAPVSTGFSILWPLSLSHSLTGDWGQGCRGPGGTTHKALHLGTPIAVIPCHECKTEGKGPLSPVPCSLYRASCHTSCGARCRKLTCARFLTSFS